MEFVQSLALVGMVLLGFGVMFRVVRPMAIFFFLLFLLILPVFLSMIAGFGSNLYDSNIAWQAWLIIIFAILIGLRILIDCICRKR